MTPTTPRDDEPSSPRSPVVMRDVAKAAGVSVATVSHVVNDNPRARIGQAARERVRRAIEELGYRPNALAKTLVTGSSSFIGLVADAIATTPFAGQIIQGAQDEAWKHGYVLLVANTGGNEAAEEQAIAMMLEHKVRGILYSTWFHRAVTPPAALAETDAVLVGCYSEDSSLQAVVPDEVQGGRTATQLLLDAGHRRIAFINTSHPSPAQTGRLEGYRELLERAGVGYDPALVVEATSDQEGGYEAAMRVLEHDVTAVFCHNDRVAMGLYDAARDRSLRVPDDLAVVGFDDQEVISAHLRPPLTTVALPHYDLGAAGVRLLLGIDEPTAGTARLVACPPVVRSSV
ncbi:LacI family DNA-binding transcriptional regulator [Nocardioides eburneiflavus]|uniref:LacI family DNA-binding transcriptional regulator n=1 Tax=Nocardioides eburneiflavus TaxID=2518372 RepID=A0A4Z1C0T0_9ACTN|nr:LacI family DNA-binding transcriptional regulator [Nocardioides eburneiflavus]TGN63734.1 LacI family DNA-binding transcriptional regulator [Nocardioides eburneiflavus]